MATRLVYVALLALVLSQTEATKIFEQAQVNNNIENVCTDPNNGCKDIEPPHVKWLRNKKKAGVISQGNRNFINHTNNNANMHSSNNVTPSDKHMPHPIPHRFTPTSSDATIDDGLINPPRHYNRPLREEMRQKKRAFRQRHHGDGDGDNNNNNGDGVVGENNDDNMYPRQGRHHRGRGFGHHRQHPSSLQQKGQEQGQKQGQEQEEFHAQRFYRTNPHPK